MSATHTPGPWLAFAAPDLASKLENADFFFAIGPREFHTVACVRPGNLFEGLPEQSPANARLIAAAPDLLIQLETLKAWAKNWDSPFINDPEFSWEPIDAAIAKAKGEPQQ